MRIRSESLQVRWLGPKPDPRRAGARYRCLYPMERLNRLGYSAGFFSPNEDLTKSIVVLDAWTLFPTVNSEQISDAAVEQVIELKKSGTRFILDNCDNQFANAHPDLAWLRGLARVRRLAQTADKVVVCSEELAKAMIQQVPEIRQCIVIDDPVEQEIYYPDDLLVRSLLSPGRKLSWLRYLRHRLTLHADRRAMRTPLVWFGSHGNQFAPGGMLDLLRLKDTLEEISKSHPLSLSIISNNKVKYQQNFLNWKIPVRYVDWDRINFLSMLRLHDISIIPINLNAFTRCKSSNRVSLSLSHGLAVIADSVPSYMKFASYIRISDWENNLLNYLINPTKRMEHVSNGREFAKKQFSIDSIARQWASVLFDDAALD